MQKDGVFRIRRTIKRKDNFLMEGKYPNCRLSGSFRYNFSGYLSVMRETNEIQTETCFLLFTCGHGKQQSRPNGYLNIILFNNIQYSYVNLLIMVGVVNLKLVFTD